MIQKSLTHAERLVGPTSRRPSCNRHVKRKLLYCGHPALADGTSALRRESIVFQTFGDQSFSMERSVAIML